jgi:hypothetical protein
MFHEAIAGPTTHRAEMSPVAGRIGLSMFGSPKELLFNEFSHAASVKTSVLGFVVAFAAVLLVFGWRRIDARRRWLMGISVATLLATAAFSRLWQPFEIRIIRGLLEDWGRFQLERVRWIEPAIVYLLLALALTIIIDLIDWKRSQRRLMASLLIVVFVVQGWNILGEHVFMKVPDSLGIRAYYAPQTMDELVSAFETDGGIRVVSVGLHPAVAVNAGLPSADGYWTAYPLDYKHEFRELIAPALDAVPKDTTYFDAWGSRAYVFQPGLARPGAFFPPSGKEIDLVIDMDGLRPLGITHIVSSSVLTNADDLGLRLVASANEPGEQVSRRHSQGGHPRDLATLPARTSRA